jgi:hypothetical protein
MTTMIPEIYAALIELGAPEEMAWSAAETLIRQLPADKVAMLRERAQVRVRGWSRTNCQTCVMPARATQSSGQSNWINISPSDRRAVGCPARRSGP